jgi:hypothetical protein
MYDWSFHLADQSFCPRSLHIIQHPTEANNQASSSDARKMVEAATGEDAMVKISDSAWSQTGSVDRRLARVAAAMRRRLRRIGRHAENGPVFYHHREMSDHLLKDIGIMPDQFDKRYALDRYNR